MANASGQREKTGALVGVIGLFLNLFLGIGKILVGFFSGSAAIISDGANNLSDAGNCVVTVSSFILGGRKADKDHPYGHGRYEYIASLLIGMVIVVVGVQFAISSITKIQNPTPVQFSVIMAVVLCVSIVVKMFMAIFYRLKGKKINSDTLRAASMDSFSDCMVTACVLIGMALTLVAPLWLDGVIALAVSIVIIIGGLKVLLETVNRLLGKSDAETANKIKKIILSDPLVVGTHDLRVHDYGPSTILASVHAEFDRNVSILEAHNVIDALEHKVFHELGIELVVHCDPIDSTDLKLNRIRHALKDIVRCYNSTTIHDLDIDYELNVVAFHLKMEESQLKKVKEHIVYQVKDAITCVLPDFQVSIEFDTY